MFRLAHVSDVHLGPLPDVTYRDLASKRMVGYVNWQRNRRHIMQDGVIGSITADIKAVGVDHLAVTGDLVNLALDGEIELARLWLETLGPPEEVSVVPGNHDAYVPGAFDKVCRFWGPWMTGDGRNAPSDRHAFPYMRVRDKVALIGVVNQSAHTEGHRSLKPEIEVEQLSAQAGPAGLPEPVGSRHPFRHNGVPAVMCGWKAFAA